MPLNPQQRINRFEKNYSAYRLIIVIILSSVLMYQDYRGTYTVKLRSYLSASLYPIQYLINLPNNFQKSFYANFLNREEIISQNQQLKEENLNLKSQMQQIPHTHIFLMKWIAVRDLEAFVAWVRVPELRNVTQMQSMYGISDFSQKHVRALCFVTFSDPYYF